MWKALGSGVLAAAVAAAGLSRADDPAKGTYQSYQVGPISVEVDVASPATAWRSGPLGGGALVASAGQSELKVSDYWIGLGAVPVSPGLQSQLNLPEGQGLQVFSVYPDSPAQKAGFREHDVLVKAAERTLSRVQDLVAAVDEAKGKKLSVDVIRVGKPMKIEVEPAKRPADLRPMAAVPGQGEGDWKTLERWLDQMPGHPGVRGPMRFRMFGPGAILPQTAPLPSNTTVTITRTGSEPARITVRQGDKTWEVTESELDKLPEDVRPQVERMLHGVRPSPLVESMPLPPSDMKPGATPNSDRVEKQLDDMNRRLEQLRRQVEERHGKKANPPPSPAPAPNKQPAGDVRTQKI